jgi:hypothetical protein
MATIEDYTTDVVCKQLKLAFSVFDTAKEPLNGTDIGESMLANVKKLEPKKISINETTKLIENSQKCAIGARVCLAVHKDTPVTESVFLDELAQGMIEAGKARTATKPEAIQTIKKYGKNPIIVSKVSGKYSEICPTWPKRCLYWNMEKYKLKCINR